MTSTPTVTLNNGSQIPLLGFGTWQLHGKKAYESVRHALEVGYRHLDTATMYGNEAEVGRAIRDSGLPREQVWVTTKLQPSHAGHERETIAASLRELGTDYVDLWLVHWPPSSGAAPRTWREFVGVQQAGQARAIGVSNYSTSQIDELIDAVGIAPTVNQIRWSPSLYDPRRVAELRERSVTLEGYSPFKTTRLKDPVLVRVAQAHGVSPAQVVLRWHLEHETVVIPKSATPSRIESNIDIFGFTLTPEEVTEIDGLGRG